MAACYNAHLNGRQRNMVNLAEAKPIGWRRRIGVIVPPSNTVNEAEFARLAPEGITFHFTRTPMHADPAHDDFKEMLGAVSHAVDDLSRANVDAVAFGCTADSMACPADRLIGTMQQASGGKPAISTAGAILAALEALGVKKISMATPYIEETNEHEKHFLEEHGLTVVAMAGLGLNTGLEGIKKMSRVPPAQVFEHAKSVDRPEAQAILICCTDFNTLDMIEPLEKELGKPVISSNTASFWAALRAAGIDDKVAGYGRLLREF
jgi:maleate cis-trans isomerase